MYKCPDCGVYFDTSPRLNAVIDQCIGRKAPVFTVVQCPTPDCDFSTGVGGEPDVDHDGEDCVMIFGFDVETERHRVESYGPGVRLNKNGTPYKE